MATAVAERVDLAADPADGAASLARSLGVELALLEELKDQLLAQRGALAADDTTRLEQIVQQVSRTLLTLREARRQRGLLVEIVVGRPGAGLAEAAAAAGTEGRMLQDLAAKIHGAAVAANRELGINQTAIRRAIESGERFLQYLLSSPGLTAPGEAPPSGLLLNQRA